MSVKNRLKEYIKHEGLSISTFEKSIGVSNGYVNSISKSIGIDKLELILENYPNLNFDWLLTGHGTMFRIKLVEKDYQFNEVNYRELADARKELIEYKELEIKQLKAKINELKKAKEPVFHSGMVAKPTEKLEK